MLEGRHEPLTEGGILVTALYKHCPPGEGRCRSAQVPLL